MDGGKNPFIRSLTGETPLTFRIDSGTFKDFLQHNYYRQTGRTANERAIQQATSPWLVRQGSREPLTRYICGLVSFSRTSIWT